MENDLDQKYTKVPEHNTAANIPNKLYAGQTPNTKFSEDESDRTVAVSRWLEELEERVMSMMGKSENKLANYNQRRADVCKVCGKEGKSDNIKDHIEANHLEGIVIPCNLCDKNFGSRNALRQHTRRHKLG